MVHPLFTRCGQGFGLPSLKDDITEAVGLQQVVSAGFEFIQLLRMATFLFPSFFFIIIIIFLIKEQIPTVPAPPVPTPSGFQEPETGI